MEGLRRLIKQMENKQRQLQERRSRPIVIDNERAEQKRMEAEERKADEFRQKMAELSREKDALKRQWVEGEEEVCTAYNRPALTLTAWF